ncbi:MAG TPA: hypothetical protein VN415_08835 [Dehalococcoidia bacterium]|nr:hypothetical protein [Dehalococcoidia bacterium]
MATKKSPKIRLDLKRKIDQLNRVRANMRLEILRMRRESGYATEDDYREAVDTLIRLEDELRDLVRQYEGQTSFHDSRD